MLDDATHGLIASGIVKLALPFDLSSKGTTILPAQYHWLRVTLQSGTAGLSDTIGVHAQAIKTAAQLTAENDTGRLSQPLAPASIAKPAVADAAVKKIRQPYESFGGQPQESDPVFRQRVSEHLRHKGRAVALYDYERMVLEQFPQLYQVKCLTHTQARVAPLEDLYLAPGFVVLAVIPEISRLQFAEKLEPKASRALLYDIEQFLQKKTSAFVSVKAVNPQFQKVDVAANVAFYPGKELAYYEEKLREDVLRFLTPWAYNDLGGPSFGGKVYQSAILHYVEKLPYVDFVTDFKLTENGSTSQPGVAVVEARTERSIIAAGNIHFSGDSAVCAPNPQTGNAQGLGQQTLGAAGGLKIGP